MFERSILNDVFDKLIHSFDIIVEELNRIFEFDIVKYEFEINCMDERFRLLPSIVMFP